MSNPEQEVTRVSQIQVCVLCQREVVGDHPVCPYDGGPLVARRPDRMLGQRIADKYEIQEVLTRGGMGVIYRARHLLLDRPVAIKCIAEVLTYDPSMWKRFEHEAKSASLLNHPNIITIHDFGVTKDGDLYLVMEYLEGASLNDFIEMNGQLSERTCAKIFIQVCDALQHAHGMKILHRDLKPTNIFISSSSRGPHVKVLDFGLAKAMVARDGDREKITRTGECLGTPDYMSPEQSRGLSVDQRSDIYACGVCMFESLTGKLPFSAEDLMQILSRQITDRPPSFKDVAPQKQINKEIEAIVMRCLEKDPQKRYESMADLGKALTAFLLKQQEAEAKAAGVAAKKGTEKHRSEKPRAEKSSDDTPVDPERAGGNEKFRAEEKRSEKPAADKPRQAADGESALPELEVETSGKNRKQGAAKVSPNMVPQVDPPSKISRITGHSAKVAFFGFAAATLILICTATAVLMPAKKEPPPLHTVNGILYYYNRKPDGASAEINVEGRTLHVAIYKNDVVKISKPEGLQNGAVWNCHYHQGAAGPEMDFADFSGSVDPTVRDADEVVRRHYGLLGRHQWEAAYDNIDSSSSLRKSSFDEFKRGFKSAKPDPESEQAPGNATKIVSVTDKAASVLVDMRYFSKGGSGFYAFQLVRKKNRWLISRVKGITSSEWQSS